MCGRQAKKDKGVFGPRNRGRDAFFVPAINPDDWKSPEGSEIFRHQEESLCVSIKEMMFWEQ
jgi:hypothetical protein